MYVFNNHLHSYVKSLKRSHLLPQFYFGWWVVSYEEDQSRNRHVGSHWSVHSMTIWQLLDQNSGLAISCTSPYSLSPHRNFCWSFSRLTCLVGLGVGAKVDSATCQPFRWRPQVSSIAYCVSIVVPFAHGRVREMTWSADFVLAFYAKSDHPCLPLCWIFQKDFQQCREWHQYASFATNQRNPCWNCWSVLQLYLYLCYFYCTRPTLCVTVCKALQLWKRAPACKLRNT